MALKIPIAHYSGTDQVVSATDELDMRNGVWFNGVQVGTTPPSTGRYRIINGRTVSSDSGSHHEITVENDLHRSCPVQLAMHQRRIAYWGAHGNSLTITNICSANNATGTATARNVATTNTISAMRRLGFVSLGIAGSSAGTRHGLAQWFRGAGTTGYQGGFLFRARFGIAQVQTNMRWFVGLRDTTTAIGNVNPSTLTNILGFGCDSGQTTVHELRNGTGAATSNDLASYGTFPATTANAVYECAIACAPGASQVSVNFQRLDDNNYGNYYENQMTVNLPVAGTIFTPELWINNGATAAAVAMDVCHWYIESDL